MSREVRYVKEGWEHPKDERGFCIPLYEGSEYESDLRYWEGEAEGFDEEEKGCTLEEWCGSRPERDKYMPDWTDDEKTHMQLYETTTEGTPKSPAFRIDQAEEMAQWLEDNGTSAFAGAGTTKEQWLKLIKGPGSAVSMVSVNGEIKSGVDFL